MIKKYTKQEVQKLLDKQVDECEKSLREHTIRLTEVKGLYMWQEKAIRAGRIILGV